MFDSNRLKNLFLYHFSRKRSSLSAFYRWSATFVHVLVANNPSRIASRNQRTESIVNSVRNLKLFCRFASLATVAMLEHYGYECNEKCIIRWGCCCRSRKSSQRTKTSKWCYAGNGDSPYSCPTEQSYFKEEDRWTHQSNHRYVVSAQSIHSRAFMQLRMPIMLTWRKFSMKMLCLRRLC